MHRMIRKFFFGFLIVFAAWFMPVNAAISKSFDHKDFLLEMENSSEHLYAQCIKKYNDYLYQHPNDIAVYIEKCKFIQLAQYDEYSDSNPNQVAFDSCTAFLAATYPNEPAVLIFQTSYLWGEELENVIHRAEKSISKNPLKWSKENLAEIYIAISDYYYWETDYQEAYNYYIRAINQEVKHKLALQYAKILVELDRDQEALEVLIAVADSTKKPWELTETAGLLLQLRAYSAALEAYRLIDSIDSTFNNNLELANSLEGIGEFDAARSYLIADTNKTWGKNAALLNLLKHDIKYQSGERCITTYNEYRNLGFKMDPIGLYRLKIFFLHPFLPITLRDILSILSLFLIVGLLALIPSIWILPVYFIGHHWNFVEKNKAFTTVWGLKAFWFVSAGYLLATLFSVFIDPETIYGHINSSYYMAELTEIQNAAMVLVFIFAFAVFGFSALYKKNLVILLSSLWPLRKSILTGIGILLLYRIAISIYVKIGMLTFNVSLDEIASFTNILLSSEEEIFSVINSYGKLTGLLIFCLLVPVYEEIIFRGVILESCQRYINFNTGNIIQAFLFATIHMNLFLFPVFFLFGIVTGILKRRSGGLLAGIVFHVFNNLLSLSVFMFK